MPQARAPGKHRFLTKSDCEVQALHVADWFQDMLATKSEKVLLHLYAEVGLSILL